MVLFKTARFAILATIVLISIGCNHSQRLVYAPTGGHTEDEEEIDYIPIASYGSAADIKDTRFMDNITFVHTPARHKKTYVPRKAIINKLAETEIDAQPSMLSQNRKNNNSNTAKNTTAKTKKEESKKEEGKPDAINENVCLKYANIIGVPSKNINNALLYNFIEEWYGVRYQFGGTDKSGIDCSGFVQRLYEQVYGVNVVRTAFEQFNTCSMVMTTDNLNEGDLVFFYTVTRSRKSKRTKRFISHVGVYLANDYFVHASTSNGVMISSLKEEYWAHKYAGAGQIPKG